MNPAEKIEHEAAFWVVRLERGLTAAEQDQFLEWLGADRRHGEELARQKAGWTRLNLLSDWRPVHGSRPNCDLLAPPLTTDPRRRWRDAWVVPSMLAAAAAIALGVFLSLSEKSPQAPSVQFASGHILPIERRTLEDGSVVDLNRGADLTVSYSAAERHITLLRGEAHFQVMKDPKRPFVVSAGGVNVRAVGTAFDVQRRATAVEVLVTEGTVDVRAAVPPGGPPMVAPARIEAGHRCVVSLTQSPSPTLAAVTREEIARVLAWQPTQLDFTEAPLRAIVAEFNRRNPPFQLVVADLALAETPLSASLRSDNVEGFLRLLEGGFDVQVERSGNVVTLHRTSRE